MCTAGISLLNPYQVYPFGKAGRIYLQPPASGICRMNAMQLPIEVVNFNQGLFFKGLVEMDRQ